jgi:glycosyltransferase involved in cell wall biosynthesis
MQASIPDPREGGADGLLLSVVVPVFNQAASIVQNLAVIRERVEAELDGDFEVLVVSDGSIDTTEDELVARAPTGAFRVFHYDRNLGKGYAVKLGALEARGSWIGYVDADLDLDPAGLATYVRHARSHDLDFAIGSKRHPDSRVHYPRSRVVASWVFQQLVRVLFRLNVRDTQVGLKVFRREVGEQVLPLLLVKRYAFDIELLAVGRAFGFDRIEELPIRLDYRFTGSGVGSRAVLRALIDTAAIFYRLRILRYYQRQRAIVGAFGWTRPRDYRPFVSVLAPVGSRFRERDYPELEVIEVDEFSMDSLRAAASSARGEVIAALEPRARAAANWLSATTAFLARPEIGAVVVPKMAPLEGPVRMLAAAAIDESRIGAGLGYFRYTPGNVRFVGAFPPASFVIRRDAFDRLQTSRMDEIVTELTGYGGRVLYTPESVVVVEPAPLFHPHLRVVAARAGANALRVRRSQVHGRRGWLKWAGGAVLVGALDAGGSIWVGAGALGAIALVGALYVLVVGIAGIAAVLRFRSLHVGALAAGGIVATHVVYFSAFVRTLVVGD